MHKHYGELKIFGSPLPTYTNKGECSLNEQTGMIFIIRGTKTGLVRFIRSHEQQRGQRLIDLQAQSPDELKVVACIQLPTSIRITEQMYFSTLVKQFGSLRTFGQWYKMNVTLANLIKAHAADGYTAQKETERRNKETVEKALKSAVESGAKRLKTKEIKLLDLVQIPWYDEEAKG